jgi:hypothetical protein
MRFTEIEHKFVVDEAFDQLAFGRMLEDLRPVRTSAVQVRDRYFLTEAGRSRQFVIRHRFDVELHQLTLKSLNADPQVRDEITIALDRGDGDQAAAIDAFIARMGVVWTGTIEKSVTVWYFADCEVVHYVASSGDTVVRCVEFEAIDQANVADALAVLDRYEQATGFAPASRSVSSLVDLLFSGVLSQKLSGMPT